MKQKMQEKTENNLLIDWENVKPIELERILSLYGMKKIEYCRLRDRSKNWFHEVLRKKKYLTYSDVKILANNIGADIFNALLEKVRKDFSQNK